MSQATTSYVAAGDGANIELSANLLGATIKKDKYIRIWRRSLYIRFLISVKKSTTSYTSLPPARTSSSKSSVAIDIEEDEQKEKEERIWSDIAQVVKDEDLKSLHDLGGVDFVSTVLGSQRQHLEPKVSAFSLHSHTHSSGALLFNNITKTKKKRNS